MKKHICILVFSPVHRDARVLRQVKYLSQYYTLTVISEGNPVADYPDVRWIKVEKQPSSLIERLSTAFCLIVGQFLPSMYRVWFFTRPVHRQMLHYALASRADAYHANDWNTLPIAVAAAQQNNAKIVADLHEYAPLEFEESPRWVRLNSPMITWLLRHYAPCVDAAITVCDPIAHRYRDEFGFDPIVVLNAPAYVDLPVREVDPSHIHIIHHGGTSRSRELERMIEAVALSDPRFILHFMLLGDEQYIHDLKQLAVQKAPDRVFFYDPVPPTDIVQRIAAYDIGFYVIAPSSYNNVVSMPNKFFDFINARLAVVIGPSPAMAEIVQRYGFGCVCSTFSPRDLADILNALTPERIMEMKQAADQAARVLNADVEMAQVTDLYARLLG